SHPPDPSNDSSPTFEFTDSEPGVTFHCRLDSGAFPPCTSPQTYADVDDGLHTFYVRAVDALGNESDPTPYQWRVDTKAPPTPTIVSGPPDPSGSKSAHFVFADDENGVNLVCQLDAAAFSHCSNPQ